MKFDADTRPGHPQGTSPNSSENQRLIIDGSDSRPASADDPGTARRRRALDRLTAALILTAALLALALPGADRPEPAPLPPPRAAYRPDGGQALSPDGPLKPNALTRINLGRRLDPALTPAVLLTALPGLGPAGAAKLADSGRLTDRQRKNLSGLINEKPPDADANNQTPENNRLPQWK